MGASELGFGNAGLPRYALHHADLYHGVPAMVGNGHDHYAAWLVELPVRTSRTHVHKAVGPERCGDLRVGFGLHANTGSMMSSFAS